MKGIDDMSDNKKLFRETPFNGYNRDDVLNYMKEQDEKLVSLEAEAENAKNEKEKYKAEIENLKNTLAEERKYAEEAKASATNIYEAEKIKGLYEALKQENEKLKEEIKNQNDQKTISENSLIDDKKILEEEVATLKQECEKLRNSLSEQENTIVEKIEKISDQETLINSLQQEILSSAEKISELEKKLNESKTEGESQIISEEAQDSGIPAADEILKSARIRSDFMIKNAEYFAFSTKEKLTEVRKTIDTALDNIEKTMLSAEELTEELSKEKND